MVNKPSPFKTKRGRPAKPRMDYDPGTPELQKRRRTLLQSCYPPPRTAILPENLHEKVTGGCLLHRLFFEGNITEEQLKIGLSFRKLYQKTLRSMGIQTRLKSVSGRLDQLRGHDIDLFESASLEKKWRSFANFLLEPTHRTETTSSAVSIILHDSPETVFTKNLVKAIQLTLDEIEKMINKWKRQ